MNNALEVHGSQPLTAEQVKAQVNLIQQVMKGVMQEGPNKHYGTVPGCGDKPTLFKAGAEKLMVTFRLAADPEVIDIPTEDGITIRVICRLTHIPTGVFVGAGIGECSTNEEKYKWERTYSQKEFDATPEDRRRIKYSTYQGKETETNQIRTNPADKANTVLKMAKKRALVDATLTATAASDIFTQDDDTLKGEKKPAPKKSDSVKSKGSGDDVRTALKKALAELCDGDVDKMQIQLKECSIFEGKEGEDKWIEGRDGIDKATEKWCGATLKKVRERLEDRKALEEAVQ